MKLRKIFIKPGTAFGSLIADWAVSNQLEVEELPLEEGFDKAVDGLVIFNQNSDIEKELLDIRKVFDDSLKPVQRIDINGTLMVGVSNFSLWLERNGCVNVLFIGADNLKDNSNFVRYMEAMKGS
jgi:hypothetical protein